jgi:hypothetical protein
VIFHPQPNQESLILNTKRKKKKMVITTKTYNSVKEIEENMDREIADTKSSLGDYLRQLDDIRSIAEKSKKIRETVMRISGKKNGFSENPGEIELEGMKVILDANAFNQLTVIEAAVRSHQERLMVLQKAREELNQLNQLGDLEGLDFLIVENQGIPERILLRAT